MIELKPCPFCGGTAHLFVNEGVRVICPNCGAIMDADTQEREGGRRKKRCEILRSPVVMGKGAAHVGISL